MGQVTDITLRPFRSSDIAETARLYYRSVREGTVTCYNEAQRKAWAPEVPDQDWWAEKLGRQQVFVADHAGTMAGFMTLEQDGEIDLAFVAPEYIGRGVAWLLYQAVMNEARQKGLQKLTAHASYLARPFFERQGWSVCKEQSVTRNGVALTNFVMELSLSG